MRAAIAAAVLALAAGACTSSEDEGPTPPPGMICQQAHEEVDTFNGGKVVICDKYTYE